MARPSWVDIKTFARSLNLENLKVRRKFLRQRYSKKQNHTTQSLLSRYVPISPTSQKLTSSYIITIM